jgi:hypothetical protein
MSQPFDAKLVVYGPPELVGKFKKNVEGPIHYPWKTSWEFASEIIKAWQKVTGREFSEFALEYQKKLHDWRYFSPEHILPSSEPSAVTSRLMELEEAHRNEIKVRVAAKNTKTPLCFEKIFPPNDKEKALPEQFAIPVWLSSIDLTWLSSERTVEASDPSTLIYSFMADGKNTGDIVTYLSTDFRPLKFGLLTADASEHEWLAQVSAQGPKLRSLRYWNRTGKNAAPRSQKGLVSFLLKELLATLKEEDF